MQGMSRMRSSFRDGHEDARLIFGLPVDQDKFRRDSRRSIPLVAELLKNSTFLDDTESGSRTNSVYRHQCLIQVCPPILDLNFTDGGIDLSLYPFWEEGTHRWNQVCYGTRLVHIPVEVQIDEHIHDCICCIHCSYLFLLDVQR